MEGTEKGLWVFLINQVNSWVEMLESVFIADGLTLKYVCIFVCVCACACAHAYVCAGRQACTYAHVHMHKYFCFVFLQKMLFDCQKSTRITLAIVCTSVSYSLITREKRFGLHWLLFVLQ